jgi:predicted lipoprotein
MQIGPAGSSATVFGGEDLRDDVYSWPTVNACRVDQELVAGEYGASDFFETRLVNVTGLDALEYVLFRDDLLNDCAPQLPINEEGQWDALGAAEIERRRSHYALALAGQIESLAGELSVRWEDGGPAHVALSRGGDGELYGSNREAMNDVMRALFYVDLTVKDLKVGRPAGLLECSTPACPELLEAPWSGGAHAALVHNLEGARMLFIGGPDRNAGFGLDDALASVDAAEIGESVIDALDEALSLAQALDEDLAAALVADPSALDGLHASIKRATDLLEGDVALALLLDIPSEVAGDAD